MIKKYSGSVKRLLALLLVFACAFCVTACREEKKDESSVDEEDFNDAKPVIYLYPEEKSDITVKLDYDGELTCSYPAYNDGWTVTACPDGALTDNSGQTYNYLYWEGMNNNNYDFSQGYCVAGDDTTAFLEDALAKLGLTRREANEIGRAHV